ncbi:ATP-dependent DNA helicase [Trichonephila clavipes]|nr:ATP-dependent DNA helicase [Trichonephila clavipes]
MDLEEELMQLEKSRAIEVNEEKSEERSLVTFEPALVYDENELVGNISLDMNASHGKGFSIFQPTNKYPDEKYRELVQKCNLKQRDLVQHLQSCLRREPAKRLHWMIQGAAGTGKSFLINIIEQMLIRMFEKPDQDPSQPTVLKLAPTGKAASNIKGETLHLALGIGLSKNARLSGSSITKYAVNIGKIDKDVELLKTKQTILEKVPKSATLLYHSNHYVDLANKIRLNSIEGPLVKSQAYDSVSGTAPNGSKQKVLDKVRKFDRDKMGNLESVIKFKVGAKYMLTYNIDTADGLVNGAVGQLKKLEYCFIKGSNNQEVKRIWLEFSNPNDIGKEKRKQCIRYTIQNKMSLLWTSIERVKKVVHRSNNDAISVTRNQFPVILAEAMTIHKSQGATFQDAAVGFNKISIAAQPSIENILGFFFPNLIFVS